MWNRIQLQSQVISQRDERGSLIITTNKAYKNWPEISNRDAGITSAILDRVLHHAETVVIEGESFRMKDHIDPTNCPPRCAHPRSHRRSPTPLALLTQWWGGFQTARSS